MGEPYTSRLIEKYQFIQIANIRNLTEEIAEKESFFFLQFHPQISIVAHATEEVQLAYEETEFRYYGIYKSKEKFH